MEESVKEQIALFRYGIIAPVINGQILNQQTYFEQQAAKTHNVPYYGLKNFSPKTLKCWLLDYRKFNFEGLKPKTRSDKGCSRIVTSSLEEQVIKARESARMLPVSVFYDQLIKNGTILPGKPSIATIYRFLFKHNLLTDKDNSCPERKRFSHEFVNSLWQGDASDGPYLTIEGRKKQTFLFAYIDDCSRVVPFAKFYFSEKFDSIVSSFKEALIRKGIPKLLYVDNGKVYRSNTLQVACAELKVILTHTKPYDAASKGKIERFFGTVKTCFFPLLRQTPAKTIEELNSRFSEWLELEYHRKPHSSLNGRTPHEVYMSQIENLKLVDIPSSLDHIFLHRVSRRVKHDGTISVNTILYEVPPKYIGKAVEVRYDESNIFIYENGKPACRPLLVDYTSNAHAKRNSISFSDMEV